MSVAVILFVCPHCPTLKTDLYERQQHLLTPPILVQESVRKEVYTAGILGVLF
jgi:hypothetical protein